MSVVSMSRTRIVMIYIVTVVVANMCVLYQP